jgi:hypothetical protein
VAGNQTDSERHFQPRWGRGWPPLRPAVQCDGLTGIHKRWRQTDLPTPYGGESLGVIGKAPRLVGKKAEEEPAVLDAVSRTAVLETWH